MENEKLYELLDNYLKGQLSDDDRATFINKMKEDIDLMIQTELERGLQIEARMSEKMRLTNKFADRYKARLTSNKGKLIEFTDQKDDRLLEFMNAAYAKNKEFLLSKDSDIDIDMIRKFLENGEDDE